MGFWLLGGDPGLLKGAWESKKLKKRRVLHCLNYFKHCVLKIVAGEVAQGNVLLREWLK